MTLSKRNFCIEVSRMWLRAGLAAFWLYIMMFWSIGLYARILSLLFYGMRLAYCRRRLFLSLTFLQLFFLLCLLSLSSFICPFCFFWSQNESQYILWTRTLWWMCKPCNTCHSKCFYCMLYYLLVKINAADLLLPRY